MKLLKRIEPGQSPRELILGYGPPGSGKTRLFTSLTERFGKIAYIAMDEGSENLDSVLAHYHERITVFKPTFEDPVIDAAEIALTSWKKEGFDTLILDTFSHLARMWLWHVTQKGLFQEKRNMVGEPGTPGAVALPDKGHYGGVHGITRNFLTTLFRNNTDINIIFVCHEVLDRDESTGRILIGGPDTVGKAMLKEFPSNFKTVIRILSSPGKMAGGKQITENKYVAKMAPHGAYVARRNEASLEGNPLPSLDLATDPINFWNRYDETSPLLLKGETSG